VCTVRRAAASRTVHTHTHTHTHTHRSFLLHKIYGVCVNVIGVGACKKRWPSLLLYSWHTCTTQQHLLLLLLLLLLFTANELSLGGSSPYPCSSSCSVAVVLTMWQ